jgi:hypothetical protein
MNICLSHATQALRDEAQLKPYRIKIKYQGRYQQFYRSNLLTPLQRMVSVSSTE